MGIMKSRWGALGLGVILAPLVAVQAETSPTQSVHGADVDCTACHTADRATLERDPRAAASLVVSDLEDRCSVCHDQGLSHQTKIRPIKDVPGALRLSAEGLITCPTCHFVHGEQNPFGNFVRIDNSRGGLCLTCHYLSELE